MTEAWRSLYPFDSHELSLDSLRYHYVDEGDGAPLLFVHGNPTWSFYWRNLILAFRESHRCIAPDNIGCGLSDKPGDYTYTLRQHTDNLLQLVERLDLKDVTLLAHDWGGAIGLGAAVELPDRFARIVLFNTAAFPPPFIPWRIQACRVPFFGKIAIQGLNAFAGAATWMATAKGLSPDVRAGLIAPYNNWSNRIANYQFVRDIPSSPRHPTWSVLENLEGNLSSLADRPMQFIWGMKDWCFTSECLDRLLTHFPDANVSKLPRAGHYVVEDAHEEIVASLHEFLANTPIAPAHIASQKTANE